MKRMSVALAACLLVAALYSCKKDDTSHNPDSPRPDPVGVVTPIGEPDADPVSQKMIGAAGGSIMSYDGRLKVIIPAGALATDQQVSIKSISNHNPIGLQQAYRIEPHGVQFTKPVTIQFIYDNDDVEASIPEALGIAYQDEKGIWKAIGGVTLDKNSHKVTITTTHFSDWSLFSSIQLRTDHSVLPVNGVTALEVYTDEDLLTPLVQPSEMPISEPKPAALKYVKEWTLGGAGKLTANGVNATYKAPSTVPARNPVAVNVRLDLKERGLFMLVCNITIEDDSNIEVRVAGGEWVKHAGDGVTKFSDNYYGIADSDGDETGRYVFIRWVGGIGTHPYKQPQDTKGTYVHYQITGGETYTCMYALPDRLVASGGGVTITSMGDEDGYVKGSFIINPAGYGNLAQTTTVEGRFKIKKTF